MHPRMYIRTYTHASSVLTSGVDKGKRNEREAVNLISLRNDFELRSKFNKSLSRFLFLPRTVLISSQNCRTDKMVLIAFPKSYFVEHVYSTSAQFLSKQRNKRKIIEDREIKLLSVWQFLNRSWYLQSNFANFSSAVVLIFSQPGSWEPFPRLQLPHCKKHIHPIKIEDNEFEDEMN